MLADEDIETGESRMRVSPSSRKRPEKDLLEWCTLFSSKPGRDSKRKISDKEDEDVTIHFFRAPSLNMRSLGPIRFDHKVWWYCVKGLPSENVNDLTSFLEGILSRIA